MAQRKEISDEVLGISRRDDFITLLRSIGTGEVKRIIRSLALDLAN